MMQLCDFDRCHCYPTAHGRDPVTNAPMRLCREHAEHIKAEQERTLKHWNAMNVRTVEDDR